MSAVPIIILAFANSPNPYEELKSLKDERLGISDSLLKTEYAQAFPLSEASLDRIERTFVKYQHRARIFHFGGHASGEGIQVEKDGELKTAFVQGLASFLGKYQGLELVFLNGCATVKQIDIFHKKAKVPIVIATKRSIDDELAKDFSTFFYGHLAENKTIKEAFDLARIQVLARHKKGVSGQERRMILDYEEEIEKDDFIYTMSIKSPDPFIGQKTLKSWYNELFTEPSPHYQPNLIGTDTYLLCDRKTANDQFYDSLDKRIKEAKSTPQFFFIHGLEQEEPNSLAQRFIRYTIKEILEQNPGRVRIKKPYLVKFPQTNDFEHKDPKMPNLRLESYLRKAFKLGHREPDSELILRRVVQNVDAVFIQHNIMAAHWHDQLPGFIEKYLKDFWGNSVINSQAYIIILFNLIYEPPKGLNKFFNRKEKTIQNELNKLEKSLSKFTLIEKLQPVTKSDVIEWRLEFLPEEESLVNQMFGSKHQLPMRQIQKALRLAIEGHNEQIGMNTSFYKSKI